MVNDMQTPTPALKKSRFIFFVRIVAQCSETNEKLIFRFLLFLFFEISILTISNDSISLSQKIRNVLKRMFELLSFFLAIIDYFPNRPVIGREAGMHMLGY